MASWSKRRRFAYGATAALLFVAAVGVPSFMYLYEAPTCFDGRENGKEQGIDCGGACARLCPSAFLAPSARWTRFTEVAPNLYNVASLLVNPNPNASARNVPYRITLYNSQAEPVARADGTVTIPAGGETLAFIGSVRTGKQTAARAVFELAGVPDWESQSKAAYSLKTVAQDYSEGPQGSSLVVTISNDGTEDAGRTAVYAILKDADQNAIDFSKTILDGVPAHGRALAPFTWPKSHDGRVVSIEVIAVAE